MPLSPSVSDDESERWAANIGDSSADPRDMIRVGGIPGGVTDSDSDGHTPHVTAWGNGWRRTVLFGSGFAVLAVLGFYAGAAALGRGAAGPAKVANGGNPRPPSHFDIAGPRSLLEAPEMVDIVSDGVRGIKPHDVSDEQLRLGVQQLLRDFGELVEENLDATNRAALRKAQLKPAEWRDLSKTLRALRDVRLQKLGYEMLHLVRSSNSTAPGQLQQELKHVLLSKKGELMKLRKDVMTKHFAKVLRRTGRREQQLSENIQLWDGMFSPEALKEMRREERPRQTIPQSAVMTRDVGAGDVAGHVRSLVDRAGAAAAQAPGAVLGGKLGQLAHQLRRRLNSGTWYSPKLSYAEMSVGITSVVLVSALELLIFLDIVVEGFQMPTWGWLMVVLPTESSAVATCMIGLSVWCDIVFGALGVNLFELFLGTFLDAPNDGGVAVPPPNAPRPPPVPAEGPKPAPAKGPEPAKPAVDEKVDEWANDEKVDEWADDGDYVDYTGVLIKNGATCGSAPLKIEATPYASLDKSEDCAAAVSGAQEAYGLAQPVRAFSFNGPMNLCNAMMDIDAKTVAAWKLTKENGADDAVCPTGWVPTKGFDMYYLEEH